jgi:hypothetical protein
MRSVVRIALSALVIATLGCGLPQGPTPTSTGSSGNPSTNNTQGTMSALIGNLPWSATGRVTATLSPAQNGTGFSILTLTGQDFPLTEMLSFSVASVTPGSVLTANTYQVGITATNANLTDANGITYQASAGVGSGTVVISTISLTARTATGAFNFVMIQSGGPISKAVVNGSFSVTF